jgi:hypothetical protein
MTKPNSLVNPIHFEDFHGRQFERLLHRELILEYPFPRKVGSKGAPKLPQRPKFSEKIVEADVRQAMAAGWDPASRGKTFVLRLPRIIN